MALEKGTQLAGYEITGVLGQGGMGVVYEATQLSLNRTVALKVLAPHLSDDVSFRERFRREGQIQAGIDHSNIVTVYEAGESEQGFFIAMRLIRGPNLKDMIVSRVLDPGRTLRILTPIAEALDEAHDAGLIHRDVKPQNVLVGGRDQAFLADFGLTKATGEQSLTRTGQFVGTFDYISPEQIKGERATRQSDVYALAAVLYECFTGVVPYPKGSEAAVLYAHMADPSPKVTEHRPELPASLDEVIAKGMAKEPEDRYATASELILDTNRAFTRRMRAAFTPPGPIETPEETGIRSAEVDVSTREATPPEQLPATEPAALEAETEPARDQTLPGETLVPPAADEPEPVPQETQRGETPATRALPPDPEALAATEPGRTRAAAAAGPAAPTAAPPARRPPARRARPGVLIGLGAAALVAVIVVGLLIGRSSGGDGDDSAPAATNLATAGPLELGFPASWQRAADAPAIPGLTLEDETALAPSGGSAGDALRVGTTNAGGPSLLPASFLARLDEAPDRDDAVKLGELEAYRYSGLRPQGFDGRLTLYAAPTTEGVATVACTGGGGASAGFLADCEEVATGLALATGRAFPLGPDEQYLDKLGASMDRLNANRRSGTRKLRQAKKQAAQAKAAEALANDYRSAGRSLSGLSVSPAVLDASSAVRSALSRTEAAYRRLAARARSGNRSGYNAARADVRAGERALRRALARVDRASS